MAKKYNKLSLDAYKAIQFDSGMLLRSFTPANPAIPAPASWISATSGGLKINLTPTLVDLSDGVDLAPANTMELKKSTGWLCTIGATLLEMTAETFALALGSSDLDSQTGKITPRGLQLTDFVDHIWWVGERNDDTIIAIDLQHVLSTNGAAITTTKNNNGTLEITLTAHLTLAAEDYTVAPIDIYVIEV